MSYKSELTTLEALASNLPFHLDESDRVNDAFNTYMTRGEKPQKVLIDLWTYCFVRRYYLIKFIRESRFRSSELDQLVENTYQKVERSRSGIESYDRYAQWVSVVCRNAYINFVSRRKLIIGLNFLADDPVEFINGVDLEANAAGIHISLLRAINRLPDFLRPTARMRFVENLSYEEISRYTGKRVPTIRSYIHKTCSRFRKDKNLKAWAEHFYD